MEEVRIPDNIIDHTSDLIASGEEVIDAIKYRLLESEEDQHDDELIDSVVREFTEHLRNLAKILDEKYGAHKFQSDFNESDFEDDEDEFYVADSYASAVWEKEDFILYLAICQADREYPITLVIGVEY